MNSTKQIRVSYLITTRNRCEYLAKTLDNVREFITPEDELIIFDAASTDETQLVAEKNKDIITLFVSEPDKGEAHGFNKGILASRGKYIKFLTDDDYFYPDVMRRSIEIMDNDAGIDILVSGGTTWDVNEKGEKSNPMERRLPKNISFKEGIILSWGPRLSGQGILLRKSAIPILGMLNCRKKFVDYDFFIRMVQSSLNIKYYDENLFDHLIWEKSGCTDIKSQPLYWQELSEGLFRIGNWNYLFMCPEKWIANALKIPSGGQSTKFVLEVIKLHKCYPNSKILFFNLAFFKFLNRILLKFKEIKNILSKIVFFSPRQKTTHKLEVDVSKAAWSREVW